MVGLATCICLDLARDHRHCLLRRDGRHEVNVVRLDVGLSDFNLGIVPSPGFLTRKSVAVRDPQPQG